MIFEVVRSTIVTQQAILNLLFWSLSFIMLFPAFKGLSKTKDKYNKAFVIVIFIFTIETDLLFMAGTFYILSDLFFLIGNYPVILLMMNLFAMTFFVFICHLFDWKKYYFIFIAGGLLQIQLGVMAGNAGALEQKVFGFNVFFWMGIFLFFDSVFLYKGLRNKDGLILSFGIYVLIMVVNLVIILNKDTFLTFQILTIIAVSILMTGTTGLIDNYIFYDRKHLKEIRNNWASKMVSKSKYDKKKVSKEPEFKSKRIQIVCPVCGVIIHKKFNAEKVKERYNNPKGLVKVYISETTFCEHNFVAYIDKNFSVRGCDSIDMIW